MFAKFLEDQKSIAKIFVYRWGSGIKCSLLELDLDNCMSPKDKNFHMEMLFQPSPPQDLFYLASFRAVQTLAHGLKNFGCLFQKLDLCFSLWIFKHG